MLIPALLMAGTVSAETTADVDTNCIKTAIEKRDSAVISAFDSYAAKIKTALQIRKEALKSAWDLTVKKDRNNAVKTAWKNFKDSRVNTQKEFKTAKLNAWKTFKTDRKTCKGGNQNIDHILGGSDSSL